MDSVRQDLRYAVRGLLKEPGFTAAAVLVMALGIGANAAMFTLVNAFLFRPLVGRNAGELLGCYSRDTKTGSYRSFSYPTYIDLRGGNSCFSHLLAHDVTMVGLTEGQNTRRVFADFISSNFFDTFGTRPVMGRSFTQAEEVPGSALPVVIATHELWVKEGGDPAFIGKTLRVNGRLLTVVGVTPEEFTGTTAMFGAELYLPLGMYDDLIHEAFKDRKLLLSARDNHTLILAGRPKPGKSLGQIQSELAVTAAAMEKAFPAENKDQTFMAHPLARTSISTNPQDNSELVTAAVMLLSVAGVVLFIACLNVANMLLARGTSRRKEFAIRLALGGGRVRILRQLLTEGLLLSGLGGIAGMFLAWWGVRLLVSSMTLMFPLQLVFHSGPDVRVLGALLGFCVLSTIASSLGPALKLSRADVVSDLKEHAGEGAGSRRALFSRPNLLVIGQISLSLTLLVTAGLFIRGAFRAAGIDPGFSLDNGAVIELDPSLAGYSESRGREIYRSCIERLRSLPGVEAVSVAQTVPLGMVSLGRGVRAADDTRQEGKAVSARLNGIGSEYFRSLGLRMAAGRPFTPAEEMGTSPVGLAIVDELLAQRLWPRQNPVGRRLYFDVKPGEPRTTMEVVGVAPPIREDLFEDGAQPHIYLPFGQEYRPNGNIHVKLAPGTPAAQAAVLAALRHEIRSVDERMPVLSFRTLREHADENIELWVVRTGARLFSTFGALALVLAVLGIYALKAYMVVQRTREIGIRLALGATARDVVWLVLRDGMRLTAAGVVVGMLLALGAARLLSSMLYDVSPTDALIFSVTPVLLGATSALACCVPARRAARIQPITALK